MKQIYHLLLFGIFISCSTSCKVTAIQPSVSVKPIPYFPAELSQVNVNMNTDLTKYLTAADQSFPAQFSGGEQPCEGLRYDYAVSRLPLDFNGSGNTITVGEKIHFNLSAVYCAKCANILGTGLRCIVPKISGSCGAGDGDPGFDISYKSAINFLPDYRVNTLTSLQSFTMLGSCPVTIFRINALPTLQAKLNGTMIGLGQKIDEKISALNYSSQVSQAWVQLNKEIALGSFGFMNINPKQLRLSTLNMNGKELAVTLGLSCLPVINTSSNPQPTLPLPDLSICKLGNGFNIVTDINIDYTTLTATLNAQIKGKEIKIGRRKFRFENGEMYGGGNSKIIIALSFAGARKGTIYFTGTPTYNNTTHQLSVPDLDFDIKTRSILLRVAAWILNAKITAQLRNAAQFNLTATLANAKSVVETNLTRQLSPNLSSVCHITEVDLTGIFPNRESLIIRPTLKGDLSVDIK